MPRLQPTLLRRAFSIEPYVAQLLPVCRDTGSARSELRWIRQHAERTIHESSAGHINRLVRNYVRRRSSGEPLQYILGSEFFGDLEIRCRPGVLIPRQETAASVTRLAGLLASNAPSLPPTLRVLDLCTGSGCMPLLFHHEFYSRQSTLKSYADVSLGLVGADISSSAIQLANENKAVQVTALRSEGCKDTSRLESLCGMAFFEADVLQNNNALAASNPPWLPHALKENDQHKAKHTYDILISNPPYISTSDYYRTTSPSVRHFEPKLALVPPAVDKDEHTTRDGDLFYPHILRAAKELDSQVILMEVADLHQARRIASLVIQQDTWDRVEIWRDDPSGDSSDLEEELSLQYENDVVNVPIRGNGEGRCVVAWRRSGRAWLGTL